MFFPTGNHDKTLNLDVSGIYVHFYDYPKRNMKAFKIHQAGKEILALKGLDKTKKFVMLVGGYTSNVTTVEQQFKNAFRSLPNTYLIIIDHSPYTNDKIGLVKSYNRAVKYVYYIGKALADMLTVMRNGGISPKNMRCSGHSLGGQILGHTGEIFHKNTKEKIWRITGLDPAGPCFSKSPIQEQVRSGVAEYVEVYHCNAGELGTTSKIGDIDFFINKEGRVQPNCQTPGVPDILDVEGHSCHHSACVKIWASTVKNPNLYLARECDSYKNFKNGKCDHNKKTVAGFWNPGKVKGIFYFLTSNRSLRSRPNHRKQRLVRPQCQYYRM